ncbi:MAG: ParA family protein [Nitrosopumilus sp.]|nr:ParA family protein [Nitrosopumilus sp.]
MVKTIAFHSYKGGTGKTTIAANLSTLLVSRGFNVLLIDMDVYAPSLHVYFNSQPEKWMNNYLLGDLEFPDVVYDYTHIIQDFYLPDSSNIKKGIFNIVFSNPKKEAITSLDLQNRESSKTQMLKKMLYLREKTNPDIKYDYIILDTSPGIRHWSINTLAIADIIILSLKMDHIDIEGTKQMASDVYKSFINFGAKSYLLLNRTAGYCSPSLSNKEMISKPGRFEFTMLEQSETMTELENYLKMDVVSTIPCYCDIQFERQEFVTVLKYPHHPFVGKMNELINKISQTN